MGIFNDFLNHEAEAQKREKELKALDEAIAARVKEEKSLLEKVVKLQSKLAEIKSLFPGESEEEAIRAYYESLKQRNEALENENVNLVLKIDTNRRKLETIKASLTQFRTSLVRPEDVVIAIYKTGSEVLAVNAFLYVGDSKAYSPEEKKDIDVMYYRSLGGERLIGLNLVLGEFVNINEVKASDGYEVNTEPVGFCRFEDWCIVLDYSLHLSNMVSIDQINETLENFRRRYIITNDGDSISITRKRIPTEGHIIF